MIHSLVICSQETVPVFSDTSHSPTKNNDETHSEIITHFKTDSTSTDEKVKCPHCDKMCKGERGKQIHISKAHPTLHSRRCKIIPNS